MDDDNQQFEETLKKLTKRGTKEKTAKQYLGNLENLIQENSIATDEDDSDSQIPSDIQIGYARIVRNEGDGKKPISSRSPSGKFSSSTK